MLSKEDNKRNKAIFSKIKMLSNRLRFKIIELTQENELSITQLSSRLKLSYTKCADYITMLEKHSLIQKIRDGKEVKVRSKVKLNKNKIEFK
jgi:predicted transcriptional regulator